MAFPVAAASAAVSVVKGLFGDAHPKDRERLQRNQWLAEMAANGDVTAFYHLGLMSRHEAAPVAYTFGPLPDGWTGSVPQGKKWNGREWGWPTKRAADDAWKKYQALAPYYTNTGGASGNAATVGNPAAGSPGNFADTQPQAPFTFRGNQTQSGAGIREAGGGLLLWLGLGIAAAYFLKGKV